MVAFAQSGGKFVLNGRVIYEPFARQLAYHNSPATYPLYGGSKGSGKSLAVRFDHYIPSLMVPGLKTLILRRKLVELQRSHLRFVTKEKQVLGLDDRAWKPSDVGAGVLYFPNGSLIEFGHCQHETDVDQYLSAEYDRISFDEIITFTEFQYLTICSCCRTTIPGLVPRVGGATNPGGSAANWVKRRWIDKDITDDEDPDYRVEDYDYIPALPTDNPHLDWPQYMKMLNRLPPELRRAYRDGDWNIFIGQFFPEFKRSAHVQEFELAPASIPRTAGLDWGYASEGVYLWTCYHPDGFLDVEDEYVFNGPRRDKQIGREVAQEIVRRSAARGIKVRRTYADPSMGEQRGQDTHETQLDTFRKHGVPCEPANNDRVNGWARMRAWLRNRPDGQPFLRIHPRCAYLIRTLGAMVMDEQKPEDMDTESSDHACFVADTRILTRRGDRRIVDVDLADEVWTREGWKPVEVLAMTSDQAPLLRLALSNGGSLTGTPNHPIWTENRGKIRLDALRYGDILYGWEIPSVTITERPGKSGAGRMARSLAAITFIIVTAIRATTPLRIWNACRRSSTFPSTVARSLRGSNIWPPFGRSRWRGIAPLPAAHGTASTHAMPGSDDRSSRNTAPSAIRRSRISVCTPSFARTRARRWLDTVLVSITNGDPAWYAANHSSSTNTTERAPVRAPVVAVVGIFPAGIGTVYNLQVAECHEYVANGVLVSNCDALRYVIAARQAPPEARLTPSYPPGTAGYLKQQLVSRDVHRRVLGAGNVRLRKYAY